MAIVKNDYRTRVGLTQNSANYIRNCNDKMYALVQYEDNIYYVCKSKCIGNSKGIIKATYSDGRKYVASIIAKNGVIIFFCFCIM